MHLKLTNRILLFKLFCHTLVFYNPLFTHSNKWSWGPKCDRSAALNDGMLQAAAGILTTYIDHNNGCMGQIPCKYWHSGSKRVWSNGYTCTLDKSLALMEFCESSARNIGIAAKAQKVLYISHMAGEDEYCHSSSKRVKTLWTCTTL